MRSNSTGVVAGSFLVGIIATATAWAAEPTRWAPIDRITQVTTGDLTLTADSLTFGNGATIRLKRIATHKPGRWSATNDHEPGDIFKVDPPANPKLPYNNVLCDKPATYVVISYPVEGEAYLSVYTDADPPKGDGSDHACTAFSYTAG
jgi:hypothetical protein